MTLRGGHLGLLLILLVTTGRGLADDPPQPASASPQRIEEPAPSARAVLPSPQVGPAPLPVGVPFDLWYLWGEDGRPVVVPDKVHLREYLNWLMRRQNGQAGPVAYSIAQVAGVGTADDDRVQLSVKIQVQTTDEDWALIPLQMAEATLGAPAEYQGAGEVLPGPFHPETGYTWWFRGKGPRESGRHELTLSLGLPIRKQPGGKRIQLALPPTAVSTLKLRIPQTRVTARGSDKSIVSVTRDEQGSLIEVAGLGARLDLSWQAVPEPLEGATNLEVGASITATLLPADRTATLEATQNIRALNQLGTFDEVRVTLPPGSELLRVDGPEYRDHRTTPENPQQVLVRLKGPTTGPVDLRWSVRMPLPPVGEPVVIEGFDVERASFQTGILAVGVQGEYRTSQLPDDEKWARRIDMADLPPALRQTRTTSAYRFVNRLRLRLGLQPVDPYVTVAPRVWMEVDSLGVEFTAKYALQVLRGSIPEVTLHWPGWKSAGWNVESLAGSDGLEPRLLDDPRAGDDLRIEFAEPARGAVELVLRARRRIEAEGSTFDLTLPVPQTAARSSTLLALGCPANFEIALRSGPETVLRPYADAITAVGVPRNRRELRVEGYRIESAEARLSAAATRHRRTLAVATVVEASPRPSTVAIRQRIDYDVAYDSLSKVLLELPRGLRLSQLRVQTPDGTNLPVRSADDEGGPQVEIVLDTPRTGRFSIDLRYALESRDVQRAEGDQALSLPLVAAVDAEFRSLEFRWRDPNGREARVTGEGWRRGPAPDGDWIWTLSGSATTIDLVLDRRAGGWNGATISRALLRSTAGADGAVRTRAEYRISGHVPELSLVFPPETRPLEFRWNERALQPLATKTDARGETTCQIALEKSGRGDVDQLLSVEMLSQGALPSRFTSQSQLVAPRLPEDLPVLDCLWQVVLPVGQHLFVEPDGFAPEFDWKRTGLFWKRVPRLDDLELAHWIGISSDDWESTGAGNDYPYLFRRSGTVSTITVRTMGESGIVLIGAGTALLVGWLLLKWPGASYVPPLLGVAFALACLAVWQAGPLLVLLQPAVFGLLLAAIGVGLDAYVNRRRRGMTVTLASPSGFLTSASSVPRSPAIVAGSNDHTSIRTPELPLPDVEPAGRLSESGSRG